MPRSDDVRGGRGVPDRLPDLVCRRSSTAPQLQPGETLLVHAAAGGVGIAAVQIGKALGARVIATAGGADKLAVARAARAPTWCIDYREPRTGWSAVKEATGGKGADVIYDSVGGDVFDQSLKCIAWNGRLLVIGFASGAIPEVKAEPHPAEEHRGGRPALGRVREARARAHPRDLRGAVPALRRGEDPARDLQHLPARASCRPRSRRSARASDLRQGDRHALRTASRPPGPPARTPGAAFTALRFRRRSRLRRGPSPRRPRALGSASRG